TCEAPVEEQPAPAEEAPVATVADDDDRTSYVPVEGDDAIVFSAASKNETIDDRYAELSDESKSYFDEIVKYALSKSDEVKRVKNARYEERSEERRVGKERRARNGSAECKGEECDRLQL